MNVLLVYATNSGTTMTAAESVMQGLQAAGHTVTMKLANESTVEEMSTFDFIILASPSWDYDGKEGQPHEFFRDLIEKSADKTAEGKKFAIMGLGDRSYTYFCGAVDHLEKFVAGLKGTLIVPSLRIDTYYQNLPTNTKAIEDWTQQLIQTLK